MSTPITSLQKEYKPGLENISGLMNEFYTLLVVADTALTAGSLPPGGAEVGARLKLEAGKLPAPFREVLTALATSGGDKVLLGSTGILRNQAQLQLDRIMGLMAMQVSEPCKRGVEGRYPLAAVTQDASIEDFSLVFAVGGAADEFFNKHLAPYVDTSVRPWRYKNPDVANATRQEHHDLSPDSHIRLGAAQHRDSRDEGEGTS